MNTRERILNVAEVLFAEKGFGGVSVREIASKARTNIGAISYHFGSKKGLYIAVFRERFSKRARKVLERFKKLLKKASSLEDVISAFSKAVITESMTAEERKLHYKLFAREMVEPTEAFDVIFKEAAGPLLRELLHALSSFGFPEKELRIPVLSVLSQVIFFNFARPMVERFTGRKYTKSFEKDLLKHIETFSSCGLRGVLGA